MRRTVRRPDVSRAYGAGEIVLFPGKADHLYRVRAGLVRLHTVDDDGVGVTLRYVKPGGYFGEERLIDRPRRYFAEAVTRSDIEELDAEQLDPDQQRDLARRLAAVIDGMNRAMHRLAGKPLRARIAAELLELSDSELAMRLADGTPVVRVTHDDLAAAVGSVRETVTKVVGELARTGAIRAGYGKITVQDAAKLRAEAGDERP